MLKKNTIKNFSFPTVQLEQNSDQGAYKVSASLSFSAGNVKNLATSSSTGECSKIITKGRKAGDHKVRQAPQQVQQLNLPTCILKEVISLICSKGNQISKEWPISQKVIRSLSWSILHCSLGRQGKDCQTIRAESESIHLMTHFSHLLSS